MAGQGGKIKWFGDKLSKHVKTQYVKKLHLMSEYVRTRTVLNISIPTATYGPSKPGEYPHADTGRMRNDVFRNVNANELYAIVATSLDYGKKHEIFTGRSWLRRTLKEQIGAIRKIALKKLPKKK